MGKAGQLSRRRTDDLHAHPPRTRSAMKSHRAGQCDKTVNVTAVSSRSNSSATLFMSSLQHSYHEDEVSNAELGCAILDQEPLLASHRLDSTTTTSSSSSSKEGTCPPVRHEAAYRDIGLGLCPSGVRYHTESWPNSRILVFLDNAMSWFTMFGYTSIIYLLVGVGWLGWYTSFWPLFALAAGFALSVLAPPQPLMWEWFQHTALVSSWRRYFDFSIACSNSLDPSRRYIFAEYPHGVFPVSQLLSRSLLLKVWPQMRVYSIAASVVFQVPVWKHIMTWTGARPATEANFKQLLQRGSVGLTPGGIAEMFLTHPQREVIKVRERKGFVRIAVETGTPIVPVYHFGNSLLFRWIAPQQLESWARRFRVAVGYTCGRWGTPLPNKASLFMAIGDPIPVQQVSPEDPEFAAVVDATHRQFEEALVKLYHRYRGQYGWQQRELVVM